MSRKNKIALIILFFLFVTPFFAANWLFYHHGTEISKHLGTVNHGRFIQPSIDLNQIIGPAVAPLSLKPKLYLLYVSTAKDSKSTHSALDKIYRIRLALGKDFSKVGELCGLMTGNALAPNPLKITTLTLSSEGIAKLLTFSKEPQGIFLMDSSWHIFMAYSVNAKSDDIYQDIRRLISNQ